MQISCTKLWVSQVAGGEWEAGPGPSTWILTMFQGNHKAVQISATEIGGTDLNRSIGWGEMFPLASSWQNSELKLVLDTVQACQPACFSTNEDCTVILSLQMSYPIQISSSGVAMPMGHAWHRVGGEQSQTSSQGNFLLHGNVCTLTTGLHWNFIRTGKSDKIGP